MCTVNQCNSALTFQFVYGPLFHVSQGTSYCVSYSVFKLLNFDSTCTSSETVNTESVNSNALYVVLVLLYHN